MRQPEIPPLFQAALESVFKIYPPIPTNSAMICPFPTSKGQAYAPHHSPTHQPLARISP
ncbi:hypothetical protein GCWU000324_00487 [Kingella oralis ATCC 51147]|uniref:Uncharacterized protein n=1 Tax=Kingella oralis ATCC 51147 TaxID=629741 RepID=C4GHZ9_9NEIS|nr:hypothetical protein GCWU000324_00487 [Kingella oralis ATCC 51147]